MKLKLSILTLSAAGLLAASPALGQGHEDILRFSDYNWSFGTARTAAMGGAFTSLGADLSSMMQNPAGLGMYRRSEVGFTLGYTMQKAETTLSDIGTYNTSANRNRFALNNVGGAFNVFNGSGALTSISLGFTYNKLIDHNSRSVTRGMSNYSMAHNFMDRLNDSNLTPGQLEDYFNNDGQYAGWMGEVLAWNSWLLENDDLQAKKYNLNQTIRDGSDLYSEFTRRSSGSTGQYDLSMGMNFGNKLYLGFGFGLQDIYYKESSEYYEHTEDGPSEQYQLDYYIYTPHVKQSGSAWNFKIGAIVRPIEELRIGIAFHTPTYISMEDTYYATMDTKLYNENARWAVSRDFRFTYNMRTPMRFLTGISYTFFNTAILTMDYERVWYNQMKMFEDGWDTELDFVTDEVKGFYKPANNFRVGLEAMVADNWPVRVGFAYYDSMYKDAALIKNESAFEKYDGRRMNYSLGFGYRTANWGIDLAYVYMDTKDVPRFAFNNTWGNSAAYKTDLQRHNIALTSSWRF